MEATGHLDDYAAVLRRRWRAIAAGVLAGALLGGAAWLALPKTYTASTAIQVTPLGQDLDPGGGAGRTNSEVNLDTEAQVLSSTVVAAGAAELLSGDAGDAAAVADMRDRVAVTVPPNSSVLEISYAAGSPEAASDGAAAFADAYLSYRADRVGGRIDAQLEALQAELDAKYAELETLAEEVDDASGAAELEAQARLDTASEEVAALNAEGTPLRAARGSLSPGTVITPAAAPDSASSPMLPLWLAAGALLGLLAGVALAWLRERHRTSPATVPEEWTSGQAAVERVEEAAEAR